MSNDLDPEQDRQNVVLIWVQTICKVIGKKRDEQALSDEGITVFKIFIWGGISLDIPSEIKFYGDSRAQIGVLQTA